MSYSRINWENKPSTNTPINAENLNKMDAGIAAVTVSEEETATKVSVLEGRVDEITTLPEGSTTGDAELADIRVGADGVTYQNAGTAVRTQITNVKNDLRDVESEIYLYSQRPIASSATGWRLNESDGLCSSASEYKLVKYAVTAGEELKIVSDDRFQFQTVASVPSSGENKRVGITYGTGTYILAVPETATYLIVSTPIEGSSEVSTVQSALDKMQNEVSNIETDLNNIIDIKLNVADWELGFRYVNDGVDSFYSGGNERASTKRGTFIDLKKGDCIVNLKTARYDVRGGYSEDGIAWTAFEMLTRMYYVAPVTGKYFLRVDDVTKSVLTSADIENINASIFIASENGTASIESLNPDLGSRITEAKRGINLTADGYLSVSKPLALLHFSDIHGDDLELARVVDLLDKKRALIDDAICTGDIITARWSDGMTFWDGVSGSEKILLAIGNHDVMTASTGYDDTQRATQAEQYARYIEPYYTNWGISSSITGNLTYYYKDYPDSKIRLIILNDMLESSDMEAQKTWLAATLSASITAEYGVVIAHHSQVPDSVAINCGFTNIDKFGLNGYADYRSEVDTFIGNGGTFICYLCGHLHWDQISVYTGTNGKQLSISIDCLNVGQGNTFSDTQRIIGFKSQDLMNIVVFDTSSSAIKIIRVGADLDHYLRQKNILTIKYDGTIVTQH